LLAAYFLRQCNRVHSEIRTTLSSEALNLLAHYDWPGNVRQLKNVIERAVILSENGEIFPRHLPPEIVSEKAKGKGFELRDLEIPPEGLPLEDVEKEVIRKALAMTEGNLSKAARILSITRDTLRYRIKKLNLIN
jgi:DNA-binding NtrC family response regulator